MTLRATALRELAGDPRFPSLRILERWVAGADKSALISAITRREWPIPVTWWLSDEERRLMRRRASVLALVAEREHLVS